VITRVLATVAPGEVRVAAVQDGALVDFCLWRPGSPDGVGDVSRGRVTAVMPALAGAFVTIGTTVGFLPDSAGAAGLSEGQAVVVRTIRAAQGGKGPRLALAAEIAAEGGPPGLLRRGPGGVERLAALHPQAPVLVDDHALAAALRPSLGDRLAVVPAAFDAAVLDQVEALDAADVALPGGLRATIHPTPALVAIDVDTGSASGARQAKAAMQFAANRAALPALARQIRLRNLSGAILIDLAGLAAKRRAALGPALQAALDEDKLQPRLLGFTALGLAEILRARVHPPLHELQRGPLAAGLAALRLVAAESASRPAWQPALRAAPAVVAALQDDAAGLADLARRAGRPLMLRTDPRLPPESWELDTGKTDD
jgi:Ribonuclease G/E